MATRVSASDLVPRLLVEHGGLTGRQLRVDGTAVLIDISGFTTLSEQLAAAGREGTEQLIATLSRIFTVLLPATDDGGDILKFAGDALFVLFRGEDHAKHAAHAAWNMNRVLAAIGDIHLPAARARLRMSVGVHTGRFELLLTGSDSVSVVLAGAATDRVLELQGAAAAGRILVSAETAAQLPPKQTAPEDGVEGGFRLLRAGTVQAHSLLALNTGSASGGERFLPKAFRQRPDLLGAEPDHRWAAIAFVQVTGLPAEPGDEDLARIDALTAVVEAALADTGATLLDVDPAIGGYRYFLTAGSPTTTEDPEGRLLTAVQRIVASDTGLSVRAGVTAGRVFSGFVGAMNRQTFTVMGDSTNLAARLTARAAEGTVLVTRAALERSAVVFDAEDGGEITVKGKAEKIPVAVVTTPGRRPDGVIGDIPFLGRDAELGQLIALQDAAATGFGGSITVSAGAGLGKSRLLATAVEQCPLPVIRVNGDRFAGAAYRALQALLRPLLGIDVEAPADVAGAQLTRAVAGLRPALAMWVPLLAPMAGADVESTPAVDALDDSFRQERAHAVLGRLLEDLLPTPTCVLVDDAHWIDEASAAALAHVFSGDIGHAVLVARREVEGGLTLPGRVIELGGLPADAASDLVETVAGRTLLPSDLAPMLARAEGNPLYLTELAAAFGSGSEALGIEQLVGERIDALAEQERAVVRRSAVLGWGVPVGLFVRWVGPLELAESEGVSGFLERLEDSVRFRSPLFRDVAYEQLNFQTRRELHRAVAAALEVEPELAAGPVEPMLAMHYEAAGDLPRAWRAAEATAKAAEQAFAVEDAVAAYRVAVASAARSRPHPPELGGLWLGLARTAVASGRAGEGLEAYDRARALTTDPLERGRIDQDRAYALNVLGRAADAATAVRAARRIATRAGADGRSLLASLSVTEAGLRLRQAKWSDAQLLAREAIDLLDGDAATDDDRRILADAFRYHDIAAGEIDGDAAMTHLQRALDLYDHIGDELSRSKVLNILGARAYYRGAWTTAAGLYAQAQDAAERGGDVVGAAIEAANAAEILIDQGRVDDALPLLKSSRRVFQGSDNPYLVSFVTGFEGRAHLRAGRADAAASAFSIAAAGFAALDDADGVLDVSARRVEALLEAGIETAARETLAGLGSVPPAGSAASLVLRLRARLAAADGDGEAARDLARSAADAAGPVMFERALSLAELARASGPDGALLLAEAETILGELGVIDIPSVLAPHAALAPRPAPEAETSP
ncbi:adenylate/guanylate cyclase domain-containing protein [Microbacterium sp. CFBP9034]|uniref:adenylate/guanylate cyclase domain-containing protein n=1 Tax=Microbacterium sp. CFBP9034 TaxID=3096540 RepID=UPI002A6998EB|nr:adenylate/guanylate cyclase domain-containing protein [Microbacterium sp. CFBP9034]MDY0908354.1 adenylate/guanylate cyclase domain-containing protein [Microbacterium sp. CFBP9034]